MSSDERLDRIHRAYRAHFADLPELVRVEVECTPQPALTPDDAGALVRGFAGCNGWVRYRSALWCRQPDTETWGGDKDAPGPPLAGEWVLDDRTSKHLRPDPDHPGAFVLWTYREGAGGMPALRQMVTVLAPLKPEEVGEGTALPVLNYRVYWGGPKGDPSAIRRLFSCFAGFDLAEDRVRAHRFDE